MAGEIVNPRLDQFKFLALFITVTFSYILEGELVDYDSKTEKWWKYVIRLLIGLGIFALFYFGLSFLFDLIIDTVTWTGIEFTMDLVRYAFLGPILILLTPWIIQKLKI